MTVLDQQDVERQGPIAGWGGKDTVDGRIHLKDFDRPTRPTEALPS
jgi:hypothetical protein